MRTTEELLNKIKEHNKAYRLGNPIVSDAEYDAEIAELKRLDSNNAWFKHIEPVEIHNSRKAKLPIPMKSLNKVKSISEINQWLKSLGIPETAELLIMPKFDGVSWLHDELNNITYSRGGSENEGQICSEHYKQGAFDRVQLWRTPTPIHFTFGELVFTRKAWEENFIGKKSDATGEPYKSPRNTIAGFINRDEASGLIKFADFYRYGVGPDDIDNFSTFGEILEETCQTYNQYQLFGIIHVHAISEAVLIELFKSWSKIYYIDGLVIYLNDINLWKAIGRQQTTGNPLYAMAYKHPDFSDTFETTVKNVEWKVSKSGAFKPVVNIESINTGDCIMVNPTGYNAKYIFENGIGQNAHIVVTRSGGVIPKIVEVIKEAPNENMVQQRDYLTYCPYCGSPTKWNESKVEIICTNPNCHGIQFAKIVHFYNIVGAEYMGEETLSKMFKAGYNSLKRILDITFEELLKIDTFGESTANNIIATNKKIKEGVEITQLMHASDCFQGIGQVKAKEILSKLSESERFSFINGYILIPDGFDKTPQFLALSKTKQSFLRGVTPFYNFIASNKLKILPMNTTPTLIGDKYKGFKICFSGVRDKRLEEDIVLNGGEIVGNISKNTTHLIVGDINSKSTKANRARSLGIAIITIDDFKLI